MTVADGSLVIVGDAATVLGGYYGASHTQSFELCSRCYLGEQSYGGTLVVEPDGVTAAMEGAFQRDGPLLVPVVQVNIPGQVVEAGLIVDAGKLAGGIDVLACLDTGGNQDFMVGHGKGEGIDVLGIVGERALEGVASVRCRNGDALQMVVAIHPHGCGDQSAGIGGLW